MNQSIKCRGLGVAFVAALVALGCQSSPNLTAKGIHSKAAPSPQLKVQYGQLQFAPEVNMAITIRLSDLAPRRHVMAEPPSPSPSPIPGGSISTITVTIVGRTNHLTFTDTADLNRIVDGTASFLFSNLPSDTYDVQMEAFDAQGAPIHSASGVAIVQAGARTQITLNCQPVNGSLEVVIDCHDCSPMPSSTPTAEPTSTPTAEPTSTPTPEPTPTPTPEPTPTPLVTPNCVAPISQTKIYTTVTKTMESIPVPGVSFVRTSGIAKDSQGNLFVAEGDATSQGVSALYKLAPDNTKTQLSWPAGGNKRIEDIVVDSNDNVYVSNVDSGLVVKYASGATTGTNFVTGLSRPRGLAIRSGSLYIAESTGGRVTSVSLAATPPATKSVFVQDVSQTLIAGPRGIAFDSSGNLFIADVGAGHSSILKVSPDGSTVSYFVGNCLSYVDGGPDKALFGNMFDITVDENNNIIVADYSNNKLRQVSPTGQVKTISVTDNPLLSPYGVFTEPGGRIYFSSRSAPAGLRLLY